MAVNYRGIFYNIGPRIRKTLEIFLEKIRKKKLFPSLPPFIFLLNYLGSTRGQYYNTFYSNNRIVSQCVCRFQTLSPWYYIFGYVSCSTRIGSSFAANFRLGYKTSGRFHKHFTRITYGPGKISCTICCVNVSTLGFRTALACLAMVVSYERKCL